MRSLKISCGAVLYTIINKRVYLVLGKEYENYYHYKGGCHSNETFEETAIREIYEETMGLVKLDNIILDCRNTITKNKRYILGLVYIEPIIIHQFNERKKLGNTCFPECFNEKDDMKLFSLECIFNLDLPKPTIKPILFYYKKLYNIQKKLIYNNNKI